MHINKQQTNKQNNAIYLANKHNYFLQPLQLKLYNSIGLPKNMTSIKAASVNID